MRLGMFARSSLIHPSSVDFGSTAAPPLGCISKWQWVAPPWASPVSPTKPMIVPCLTVCPLEIPGAKSLAWAQKKYVPLGMSRWTALIWAWASGGMVCELGLTVVVVVGAGGGGAAVVGGVVLGGCVGGGLTSVVVGCGRVEGALVVGGDVWGGAVVVSGGGPTIWAWACQMAPAVKAMALSATMPAARQRVLTPLLFSPPRSSSC